jgi:hypothetical protein
MNKHGLVFYNFTLFVSLPHISTKFIFSNRRKANILLLGSGIGTSTGAKFVTLETEMGFNARLKRRGIRRWSFVN